MEQIDISQRRNALEERIKALALPANAAAEDVPRVSRREWPELVPLSAAQQRMWVLEQFNPGLPVYHIPLVARLRGRLDSDALRTALTAVTARHEQLRIRIVESPSEPLQRVSADARAALPMIEASPGTDPMRLALDEVSRPFDLTNEAPARWLLIRVTPQEHLLVGTVHHIIADGWSVGVILRDLSNAYGQTLQGGPVTLAAPAVNYLDAAAWQRDWLASGEGERQLAYWQTRLGGELPVSELPTDRPRPRQQDPAGAVTYHRLSAEVTAGLRALAKAHRGTTFMVLLAGLHTLLHRYTGQTDIVTGSPIANRPVPDFDEVVGLFLNTLVYRSDCSGDPSFGELLDQIRTTSLEAFAHQDVPFDRLIDRVRVPRDPSRNPIFQINLTVQNATDGTLTMPGLDVELPDLDTRTARFDFSILATEDEDGIELASDYSTRLFDESTIQRMLRHLSNLIAAAVADPGRRLSELALLDDAERRLAIETTPGTRAPSTECLHRRFAAQAERTPDAVALTFRGIETTYRELAESTNRLSRRLRELGIGPESVVGLCVQRGPLVPIGMLGILAAGGAYLPLDPEYPANRLAFMVADSRATVIVTESGADERLPQGVQLVHLDRLLDDPGLGSVHTGQPDDGGCLPANLAYVTYTSGTTGKPKGVEVEHRNAAAFIETCIREFEITAADRIVQFSSPNFDVSMFDIFTALLSGAGLCLTDASTLHDPQRLTDLMRSQRVTIADLPPVVLGMMQQDKLPSLRLLFVGGEAFSGELVNQWQRSGRRFINGYGPTEATCACVMYECHAGDNGSPPIGRAMTHHRAYVLAANGSLAPVGVAGELYVGGVGVARGYRFRPALTAERFLPDGHSTEPLSRMYRTGDMARYRADGNLEFLGRVDDQIQLRGVRIELGEIQSVLDQHPAVTQSTVVVTGEAAAGRRLVAYIVPAAGAPDIRDVRSHLIATLPRNMVPTHIVTVDQIPLTVSGKVDRAALPPPVVMPEPDRYEEPGSALESLLADNIFTEVLGRDRVGINDNFFEMGGNSLQATQIVSRLRDALNVEVPLRAIFENPTAADLAADVAERTKIVAAIPEPVESDDELLARVQEMTEDEMDDMLAAMMRDDK